MTALLVLATFGAGLAVGRVTKRTPQERRDTGAIVVSAADNDQGAVRASTRRLKLAVDLGGACVGEDSTAGKIVRTQMRETPTVVRLVVTVREGAPASGACAGVGLAGSSEVTLKRPLGRRRIVNLAGTVAVRRGVPLREADAAGSFRLIQRPVLAARQRHGGWSIRVVLRTDRALPSGTRLQLDAGRALASLRVLEARRHCYSATIDAHADPERAPQLLDPRPGHHPMVSLVRRDGRALLTGPAEISGRRKALALIAASPLVGGLGCT